MYFMQCYFLQFNFDCLFKSIVMVKIFIKRADYFLIGPFANLVNLLYGYAACFSAVILITESLSYN